MTRIDRSLAPLMRAALTTANAGRQRWLDSQSPGRGVRAPQKPAMTGVLPLHPPTLICLIGPPAVGKMTVGQVPGGQTGYLLFHGHVVADGSPDFPFGSPVLVRLTRNWRRMFFAEAVQAGLHAVTTVTWRFDQPEDAATIESWLKP